MNNTMKRAGSLGISAAMVLASCGTVYGVVAASDNADTAWAVETPDANQAQGKLVKVESVQGTFSYNQDTLSSNADISGIFNRQVASLCGARPADECEPASIGDWQLSITGDVQNSFTATLEELSETDSKQTIMTCTCTNNMPGGDAIVNASVQGIPVTSLIKQAGIAPEVNTVVFKASDGMESALPLDYVIGHGALVVYDINDEDLSASVGGTNQLWIESSAGKYFTRDVVEVSFEARDQAPEAPTFEPGEMDYVNRPNVSVELAG
ncbi:Oxidoreductase molybdopterin binding domain [Slackia heliotrinireducens]|uniref:molybdopterin-dependent oxidoreductase n=1 Tax=Slackia heliotrinireducens TaxID=84110 RepID=UPI000F6C17EA|nr:molybdopterin-dependent oxidoreductase [Slackia heliotrinireducens]VEH02525.1 Oxidoreductase molybdopterin binding domain [Slackia heliotrinireducens]